MSNLTFNCPYCKAINRLESIKHTSRTKWGIPKFWESEETKTVEYYSEGVKCSLCEKEYDYIELTTFGWIESKIEPTDTMLQTLKIMFPDRKLASVYENVIGVCRPKKRKRDLFKNHLHVIFELDNKRACIDCHQTKKVLKGLNIFEV